MVMVFNSWLSVLLVEETGVSGENHRPIAITPPHVVIGKLLFRKTE